MDSFTMSFVVIALIVFVMSVFGAVMEMRAKRKRINILKIFKLFRKRK